MKKILLLFLLTSTNAFSTQSLANQICNNFFTKIQGYLLPANTTNRETFARYCTLLDEMQNASTQQLEYKNKIIFESIACNFFELSTELDDTLSREERLQLAKEFDFAFEEQSSGHFDRLCGIERPDKLRLQNTEEMGREIYTEFKKLLDKEKALNEFASQNTSLRHDFWPRVFVISANDPMLQNFANLQQPNLEIGLLGANPLAIQEIETHAVSNFLQHIENANAELAEKLETEVSKYETLKIDFDKKFSYCKEILPILEKNFSEVDKNNAIYQAGNIIQAFSLFYMTWSATSYATGRFCSCRLGFDSFNNYFQQKIINAAKNPQTILVPIAGNCFGMISKLNTPAFRAILKNTQFLSPIKNIAHNATMTLNDFFSTNTLKNRGGDLIFACGWQYIVPVICVKNIFLSLLDLFDKK